MASIVVENSASGGAFPGNGTGTLANFTVTEDAARPHRLMLLAIGGEQEALPTSVTYGTANFTLVVSLTANSPVAIYSLDSPAVGTADVVLTGGGSTGNQAFFGVLSLKSSNPINFHDSATASAAGAGTPALAYDDLADNGLYLEVGAQNLNTTGLADPAGSTTLFGPSNGTGGFGTLASYSTVSAGPLSNTWTFNSRYRLVGATYTSIPEPSSLGLVGVSAVGLLAAIRRRKRA